MNHKPAKEITTYTRNLSSEQGRLLSRILKQKGYSFHWLAHAKFAASREKVNVTLYRSGKLLVQGKGTQDFVQFVLEPEVIGKAELGYEDILNPERLTPRLGVDESGKGDFFGPLCVAGVYVNESVVKTFEAEGIQDSKQISSDIKIAQLAQKIFQTPGCGYTVVTIGNEAYNRLYKKMRSLNRLLAWGHARAIEDLMERKREMSPPPHFALSDQFADSKTVTKNAIMAAGKEIQLIQRHKAEADIAVAAASILARGEFLRRLRKLEKQYGLSLPKGASKAVDAAAKQFLEIRGAEEFGKVAKLHFRNAARALGKPEPLRKQRPSRRSKSSTPIQPRPSHKT